MQIHIRNGLKFADETWFILSDLHLHKSKSFKSDKDQAFCNLNAERLEAFKH